MKKKKMRNETHLRRIHGSGPDPGNLNGSHLTEESKALNTESSSVFLTRKI